MDAGARKPAGGMDAMRRGHRGKDTERSEGRREATPQGGGGRRTPIAVGGGPVLRHLAPQKCCAAGTEARRTAFGKNVAVIGGWRARVVVTTLAACASDRFERWNRSVAVRLQGQSSRVAVAVPQPFLVYEGTVGSISPLPSRCGRRNGGQTSVQGTSSWGNCQLLSVCYSKYCAKLHVQLCCKSLKLLYLRRLNKTAAWGIWVVWLPCRVDVGVCVCVGVERRALSVV